MSKKLLVVGLFALASLATAQKVKTKAEAEAVNAVLQAQNPDAKIAAAENLVSKFKDTEFKSIAWLQAGQAAQQKNDAVNALIYGDRSLQADAKNYQAMLLVAGVLAQGTKEFDFDKDEKLNRATKLSNDAIAALGTATKPNPQLPDDQWTAIKKDMIGEAHGTLAMIAMVNKKYDAAIAEYNTALTSASSPDPVTMVRLGSAQIDAGKFDEGTATLSKVLAMSGLPDQVTKAAAAEKSRAEKMKAAKK